MTVSEVPKIDLLLKKNGCVMVEYRDPVKEWFPLFKFQALMKAQNFIHYMQKNLIKRDGDTLFIVCTMKNPPKEFINFFKEHNIGLHDPSSTFFRIRYKEPFLLISNASLNVADEELTSLAQDCASLYIRLFDKKGILLDYSLSSLEYVDKWIKSNMEHLQKNLQGFDELVLAGCYAGEVIRKALKKEGIDGVWTLCNDFGGYSAVIDFAGNRGNVIGKISKQANGGAGDEIHHFALVSVKMIKEEILKKKPENFP